MVNRSGKPKESKLKLPSRTGMTIYKKDYHKQEKKYQSDETVKHSMSVDCIKTNNFVKDEPIDLKIGENTMYQSDFKFHRNKALKRSKRRC